MEDRIFGDREKAMEEAYFRERDGKLIEKLQQKARLDEIALALGDKLQVDNPDLLVKVRELGVTMDTAPAFFLAPLVQVAWASGDVSKKEHDAILRLAGARGVESGSPAFAQLEDWLRSRPSDGLFETALEVLRYAFSVLPPTEKEARIKDVGSACQEVARTSTSIRRIIGVAVGVVPVETATVENIVRTLRSRE